MLSFLIGSIIGSIVGHMIRPEKKFKPTVVFAAMLGAGLVTVVSEVFK